MAVQIELYYPHKINLQVNFPTTWNDLTEKELRYVARVSLEQNRENMAESLPLILHHILKSRTPVNAHQYLNEIDPEQIAVDLLPLLHFIHDENDRTITPEPIRRPSGALVCPAFEDITCGEFEDTEFAANQFSDDPQPKHLALLAAILFRPKNTQYIRYNKKSDTYIHYNAEGKLKSFLALKPEHLYSIFIWYAGCRSQLKFLFPDLYDGPKNKQPDPLVFTNTIHAGAGPKNGTRMDVRRTKLYEFLYDCNQEAIKAKELEASYK